MGDLIGTELSPGGEVSTKQTKLWRNNFSYATEARLKNALVRQVKNCLAFHGRNSWIKFFNATPLLSRTMEQCAIHTHAIRVSLYVQRALVSIHTGAYLSKRAGRVEQRYFNTSHALCELKQYLIVFQINRFLGSAIWDFTH